MVVLDIASNRSNINKTKMAALRPFLFLINTEKDGAIMKYIKSKIFMDEVVDNTNPHPLANDKYIKVWVYDVDGTVKPGMLTYYDVSKIIRRAANNEEDQVPRWVSLRHRVICEVATRVGKFINFFKFWKD